MVGTYAIDRFLSMPLIVRILLASWFAIICFCFCCLLHFNAHDPSWIFYSTDHTIPTHIFGSLGAHIAATLFFYWGNISWLLLCILLLVPCIIIHYPSLSGVWERLFVLPLLIGTITVMFYQYSGYMGWYLYGIFLGILPPLLINVSSCILLYASLVLLIQFKGVSYLTPLVHSMQQGIDWCIQRQIMQKMIICIYTIISLFMVPIIALKNILYQIWSGAILDGTDLVMPEDQSETYALIQQWQMPSLYSTKSIQPIERQEFSAQQEKESQLFEASTRLHSPKEIQPLHEPQISQIPKKQSISSYTVPTTSLFSKPLPKEDDASFKQILQEQARVLEQKLERFGVYGKVCAIKPGPVVTLFEYEPQIDTKISKILALEDDLALALQALSIRIIAPIPGRSVVGFEVANAQRKDVLFSSIIQSTNYIRFQGDLPLVLGQDTIGQEVIVDLVRMPHLLIAGSTGSGKSVALNTMLMSLLCKRNPDELKLILIDPKRLEFAAYADIAHLLFPIVTESKKVAPILRWVVTQMEERYVLMATTGARNVQDYNLKVQREQQLPYLVVVIDELADLMMTTGRETEDLITRITQMARAAGIHMIVATQRPSVDVITGLIKVNFPSRISFRVSSKIDSRTILDCNGADKLLGRGDMLFLDSASSILKRVHGCYVSDEERYHVNQHIRNQREPQYLDISQMTTPADDLLEGDEQLYQQVIAYLQEIDEVSISLLQRKFRIGYNRSARIMSMLESQGMIMPSETGKTRKVIK